MALPIPEKPATVEDIMHEVSRIKSVVTDAVEDGVKSALRAVKQGRDVAEDTIHDARYAIDATKLETELGWKAQENFETGIEKTVAWYLANEAWWRPLREKVYAGERLGVLATEK